MKAVIFDLGNTVFRIDFNLCLQSWASSSGKSFDEIKARFKFDEAYSAQERAEITGQIYLQHVNAQLKIQLSMDEFIRGWNGIYLPVIPETEAFLNSYHEDNRLFVLTNSNKIHREFWTKRYASILSRFEKVYCSSLIGARKPEPESYAAVLRDCGLTPDQVAFIDDSKENVVGAEAVGIKSIHFVDPKESIRSLENMISKG